MNASTNDRPTSRWRTSEPPLFWELQGDPNTGIVELPLRLYWSDRHNEFDLTDESELRLFYQIVLTEGNSDDVREFLHLPTILKIWNELWLSPAVHEVWDPWMAAHRNVAV